MAGGGACAASRVYPDAVIAGILNRQQRTTAQALVMVVTWPRENTPAPLGTS
jgi:hypothetical protein